MDAYFRMQCLDLWILFEESPNRHEVMIFRFDGYDTSLIHLFLRGGYLDLLMILEHADTFVLFREELIQ